MVAVGYADGLVLIVRLDDGAEILAKKPGDAPVTALAWSTGGRLLAWGTEDGEAGDYRLGVTGGHASPCKRDRYFFAAGVPALGAIRAAGAAGAGATALSGSRFQVWLRPNSEMPR